MREGKPAGRLGQVLASYAAQAMPGDTDVWPLVFSKLRTRAQAVGQGVQEGPGRDIGGRRLRLVLIISLVLLLAAGTAVAYALLYPVPEGFDLSLHVGDGSTADVYIITSDELEQLTDSPWEDVQARWSPDCSRILFASNRDGFPDAPHIWKIYLMNPDGTNVVKLVDRPHYSDMQAMWSPDGTRISFSRRTEAYWDPGPGPRGGRWRFSHTSDIYLVNADGSGLTRLTSGPGDKSVSDWSPDGRRFLAGQNWHDAPQEGNADVYVINVDGTGPRNLTNNAAALDGQGRWSPDGKRIVFTSNRAQLEEFGPANPHNWPEGGLDIYVMDADGGNVTRLTDHPENDIMPFWSPDGKWISFWSARISGNGGEGSDTGENWDTFVMKGDGSDIQHVIRGYGHGWSSCKARR